MGKTLNNSVQAVTGFNLGQLSLAGAVGLAAKTVGDSINLYTSYAEHVRTMSAATGMSNEDTSRMIKLFDDANVDIGLFTAAARKMVQQGVQPSVENIAKPVR